MRFFDLPFVDAHEMHKKHPETFEIPSIEELSTIENGDFVKVCIDGERFWIELTTIQPHLNDGGGPLYEGKVGNEVFTPRLNLDDFVTLRPRHIYAILKAQKGDA